MRTLRLAIVLALGIGIGYAVARRGATPRRADAVATTSIPGHPTTRGMAEGRIASRSGSAMPIPLEWWGHPASGLVLLGDFESNADVAQWETKGATLARSTLHATHGREAAEVTFQPGSEAPGIVLSKAFRARTLPADWSGFDRLAFDVFNSHGRDIRLIVQVKDQDERRYKQNVTVPASQGQSVSIPLEALGGLNLRKIHSLTIFQWKPSKETTVYLDRIRLEPAQAAGTSAPADGAIPQAAESLDETLAGVAEAERLTAARFRQRRPAWTLGGATTVRVPMSIREPSGTARTRGLASGGVPLAPGELADVRHARVVDQQGAVQPAQLTPLARWRDGSIRWLLVSLQATVGPQASQAYLLEYGPDVTAPEPASRLQVAEDAQAITVTTGPLRVAVSKRHFTIVESVWLDRNGDGQFAEDEHVARPGHFLMRFANTDYDSANDAQTYQVAIEDRGPVSVTLKASGWFRNAAGRGFGQFIVRLQLAEGDRTVRLWPTFIYTGYPANRHHHKYEGLVLPDNEPIEAVTLQLPLALAGDLTAGLGDEAGAFEGQLAAPLTLLQRRHDAYELLGLSDGPRAGRRAVGWADLRDARQGAAVIVRDFWQQYPKAFTLDPAAQTLEVALWPAQAGLLDLQTTEAAYGPDAVARGSAFGLGKTHELVVAFHANDLDTAALHRTAAAAQEPLHLRPAGAWVNDTGVLGRLAPNDTGRQLYDEVMLERLFDWGQRQQAINHWYGMLDFGDTLSWYRKDAHDKSYGDWGWHPEGRWGWFNCEAMGTHTGALLQYVRTGLWKYFQFGEDLARHIMDVDTVHYNTAAHDPRLKGVIDDAFSQVGSMHRHNANHWGGRSDEASHTSPIGILLYHYLTGSPRARDVALEVGDFFLREPMTYDGHPDIAPQRTLANILWGDTALYELTGDEAYLRGAVAMARRLLSGLQEDGSWPDTFDPTTGTWRGSRNNSFTTQYTLPALIAYHRLTNDPAAAKAIVEGTRYLITHESFYPFFDALAYSFDVTGDTQFLLVGEARLTQLARKQDASGRPEADGALTDKLTYGRAAPFLYSVPFLFDPLEHRVPSRAGDAAASVGPDSGLPGSRAGALR